MTNKKMISALNGQIKEELYSSYLYLAMSAYFESENLTGFANWMRVQAQEEISHAMKFYHYIFEREGDVELQALEKPPKSWKSTLDAMQDAYKHEQKISQMIDKLVDLAVKEKDHATSAFLQWFVNEQVEEEASVNAIVQQLKLIGDQRGGLFMLNRELGSRSAD
ncbi:ferritin [bacterium]|nr:ferritin [candidate division CSSED10-310 bacterium]